MKKSMIKILWLVLGFIPVLISAIIIVILVIIGKIAEEIAYLCECVVDIMDNHVKIPV